MEVFYKSSIDSSRAGAWRSHTFIMPWKISTAGVIVCRLRRQRLANRAAWVPSITESTVKRERNGS